MSFSDALTIAERIATQAHAGQVDKLGKPYIEHCRRVSETVLSSNLKDAKAVAWLHDILEDTDATEADLRLLFSPAIVDAVVALTHPEGERNTIYWERVRNNALARQVKIADIHDNSNPERLELLDHETARRLTIKYGKALNAITKERGS